MTIPIARLVPLGVVLLLLAHVPAAMGAGINLFWNDCSVSGVMNKNFACSNNTATFDAYVSVDPPSGITLMTGHRHLIDVQSASTTLPAWWEFVNAGACRQASLGANTQFSTGPSGGTDCLDPWQGSGTAAITAYTTGFGGDPTRARIVASVSVPEGLAGPMDAGTEYYSIKLRITSENTVGTEACGGCITPVCLVVNEVRITQLLGAPLGDVSIQNPMLSNFVYWQGGFFVPICTFVPSQNRTWGQVKSLYR